MKPFLFSIGATQIPSFFFFIMVATVVSTFYAAWLAGKNNLRREVVLDMGMLGMVAGVLGSRIFHILVEAPGYYWEKPFRVFEFWRGGFVSYGGFIGLTITFWLYFRLRKIPITAYLDLVGAAAPIIKFFVRVACLLTGCCYGKPTNVPWAITFHNPASTAYYFYPNVPLHPTEIYSMIHALLLFVFINWVYRHRKFPGQTACVLTMGWTLPRAFIEIFRGDADRGVYFSGLVSTAQITGLVIFVIALITYSRLARRHRLNPSGNNPS